MVARFGDKEAPALQEQVARALVNKGVRLGRLNRHEDAIAACDEVVARFGDKEVPALQEQVARALFNKACVFAVTGKVERCIATLEHWVEQRGEIDCEQIKRDSDFDNIRNRKTFVAFLTKHGCF